MATNEYLLESNKFQTPKVLKDRDAIAILLLRLLILEPGTIQTHPDMGVGLVSKYRYVDDTKIEDLRTDITNQVSKYLPNFIGATVDIDLNDQKELIIRITVDSVLYSFTSNGSNVTLSQL